MLASLTALLLIPLAGASAASLKPCAAPTGVSQETLLAQAEIARGLAATDAVALDPSGSCIMVRVRTAGTARLVALLLRGVKVPSEAIRFQVDSASVPSGAVRRT